MASAIHVGDVGTPFQFPCLDEKGGVLNVSAATTIRITFVRPDKSRFVVTPVFVTNGVDGLLQYSTVAGDLTLPGVYTTQVYVSWGTSPAWNSDIGTFKVQPNE